MNNLAATTEDFIWELECLIHLINTLMQVESYRIMQSKNSIAGIRDNLPVTFNENPLFPHSSVSCNHKVGGGIPGVLIYIAWPSRKITTHRSSLSSSSLLPFTHCSVVLPTSSSSFLFLPRPPLLCKDRKLLSKCLLSLERRETGPWNCRYCLSCSAVVHFASHTLPVYSISEWDHWICRRPQSSTKLLIFVLLAAIESQLVHNRDRTQYRI